MRHDTPLLIGIGAGVLLLVGGFVVFTLWLQAPAVSETPGEPAASDASSTQLRALREEVQSLRSGLLSVEERLFGIEVRLGEVEDRMILAPSVDEVLDLGDLPSRLEEGSAGTPGVARLDEPSSRHPEEDVGGEEAVSVEVLPDGSVSDPTRRAIGEVLQEIRAQEAREREEARLRREIEWVGRMVEKMVEPLRLAPSQADALEQIFAAEATERHRLRTDVDWDLMTEAQRDQVRQAMGDLRERREEAVRQVLDDHQIQQYHKVQERWRSRWDGRERDRDRGPGGGPRESDRR